MFQTFQVFLAAALVLALLPGPSIFYVSTRSLAAGRLEGLASGAGTGIGGMVHVAAGALGVSAIVLASAKLFALMKLAGAVYLVWMGIGMIRSARRDAAMLQAVEVLPANPRRAVVDGIFVEALNPRRRRSSSPSCRNSSIFRADMWRCNSPCWGWFRWR